MFAGTTQQPNQQGLIVAWVQGGEQSMKSYPLGPNQKAFLFSTEENIFGIKSTDANGMPFPLEIFKYERLGAAPAQNQTPPQTIIDTSAFVTREELDARITSLVKELSSNPKPARINQNGNGGEQKHGK